MMKIYYDKSEKNIKFMLCLNRKWITVFRLQRLRCHKWNSLDENYWKLKQLWWTNSQNLTWNDLTLRFTPNERTMLKCAGSHFFTLTFKTWLLVVYITGNVMRFSSILKIHDCHNFVEKKIISFTRVSDTHAVPCINGVKYILIHSWCVVKPWSCSADAASCPS